MIEDSRDGRTRKLTDLEGSRGDLGAAGASGLSGTLLGHFEVLDLLGSGGYGEVYRARDLKLGRLVAVKVLPESFDRDPERRERLHREAIAASALNHPNICTVHELLEVDGRSLIVMELVEGTTLRALLERGPLSVAEALPIARQVADALAEAHRAGILHRDVKSGNIAVTSRGLVKVLDFGLAKLFGPAPEDQATQQKITADGTTSGTLSYMSPEQLLGLPLDRRSDLFSLGVVLHEMVTGRLPFTGISSVAVADAILHARPLGLGDRALPGSLKAVILRLLEKDAGRRYSTAEEVSRELERVATETARPTRRRPGGLAIVLAALVVVAVAAWAGHRWSRQRRALGAIPEVVRLLDSRDYTGAAALLKEARAALPEEPSLGDLWRRATGSVSIETVPEGARVAVRPYRGDPEAWEEIGVTPIRDARLPRDWYVWRVRREGFATRELVDGTPLEKSLRLDPEGSVPPGMVRVQLPGREAGLSIPGMEHHPSVLLDDYFIDGTEVTNEEFRRFVASGGYQSKEHWREPFLRDGRAVPWEEAVSAFRDATGRPGPATWEVGAYPEGLGSHPVGGISWYEAAAYAAWAGKRLPTIYHWNGAARPDLAMLIVPGSNMGGGAAVPVGGPGALGGYGTYDMAGNVKEWCWNESRGGKRFLLGGGFGEPSYLFVDYDAQSPWDRRPNYGVRCVKLASAPPREAAARLEPAWRDYAKERPVSDEVFRVYRSLYAYDRRPLNAKVEEREVAEEWTREKVSFDAAYGGERVVAHLYLPRGADPPYQTVVYFPGSSAIYYDDLNTAGFGGHDFVPKSGRAFLYPVYKSTYERRDGLASDVPDTTASYRDHVVFWSKDLGRSLDYLETRPDVDRTKLAYLGYSWGVQVAPMLLAVEERFRVAVFLSGGFMFQRALPEADQVNFVSRVKIPVLMLNGRLDFFFPVETAQLPFLRMLGTPPEDRRHVLFDSGHVPPPKERIRETLDWLDRYLGPVERHEAPGHR